MHVDGLVEIKTVDGYEIVPKMNENLKGKSEIITHKLRDLAPKKTAD